MKKTFSIENKSKQNYFIFNQNNFLSSNFLESLFDYSSRRDLELSENLKLRNKLNYKDNITNKIINKNQKDYNKKVKEYNQLLDFLSEIKLDYNIIDFETEIFDAILEIDEKIIGIEITQLILKQNLKEFYERTRKVLNNIENENTTIKNSLIEIELKESLFFQNKEAFIKNLEKDVVNLINHKSENLQTISNYSIMKVEDNIFHIYINNYPPINTIINNTIISKKLLEKDEKLSKKILQKQKFSNYEKWLFIYSEGNFYDDYIRIDSDTFNNLHSENFDKLIFFNKKRSDLFLIDFK